MRRIWKRYAERGISYAVAYGGQQFDGTGTLRLGTDMVGLTCATFVLAAVRAFARWTCSPPRGREVPIGFDLASQRMGDLETRLPATSAG